MTRSAGDEKSSRTSHSTAYSAIAAPPSPPYSQPGVADGAPHSTWRPTPDVTSSVGARGGPGVRTVPTALLGLVAANGE